MLTWDPLNLDPFFHAHPEAFVVLAVVFAVLGFWQEMRRDG